MTQSEFIESRVVALRGALRMSKGTRAWATEKTYVGWVSRFLRFSFSQGDWKTAGAVELARRFVAAHVERWSVATTDQFRNALVWYFKNVVKKPLGDLGPWAEARRPKRLPVWLPCPDMMALIGCMRGREKLMAQVGFGSGARSRELARLRWKDIDFTGGTIAVRGGKGDKDRVTLLPRSVEGALREHMEECRGLWLRDRREGKPGVEVPSGKFDGTSWQWFWVWPAWSESRDPRSGIVRRHHVHQSTLGKAITAAVKRWGGNQKVTVHSLRHSFATALLMEGTPIQEVQALLGHEHLETTQIYAHVLPRLTMRVRSPMDAAEGKVVAIFGESGNEKVESGNFGGAWG